jgi:ATP-binding cassette subfamily B multidrug efflux pump
MSRDDYPKTNNGPKHGPGAMIGREKPKSFSDAWKKIFAYLRRDSKLIWCAVILAAAGSILTLIGPNQLSDVTDMITAGVRTGNMDIGGIAAICTLLVCLYAASSILSFLQNFIMATVSQRTARNMRNDISEKINRMPLRYFDSTSHGDVLSRVTNDVDTIGQSMNQSISILASAVTLFLGSLLMMLITNLKMTAAAVAATVIGFLLMMLIMRYSQKYFGIQQKNLGAMNGHVEEIYNGHNIVKAYNGERAARERFDQINGELYRSAYKSQFLSGLMMPLMSFIGNLGYVAVCVVGAVLVIDGEISIGVIVAFMLYVRLFTMPLSQMAQAFTSMQSTAAAAERVFEFLGGPEMEDEKDKVQKLEAVRGDVEFCDVHFSYVPGKEVIHGFSAKVKAGQKVAIVGPTGAGKTTMVNLLMRFYETDSGEIKIDGIPTKNVRRENIHDLFCMVLQDTWLFQGTVRENVTYSMEGVTDEQVVAACKAVGVHHFIMTLPKGYDTILDDKSGVSAGQRQQITIARAIIKNAPLLILDEATSSIDTRTEKVIQEAMDKLMRGRTSFVIAHRLSTIKNADLILVMKNGSIVEQGTHEQLLAKGGFYQELYDSQFEDVEIES